MILAIDPGLTGALALYAPDVEFLLTERLPVQWRLVNKKKKHEIDLSALYRWLVTRRHNITSVILEQPTAMPGAGATGQFNFGRTCGQIEGLLVGLGLTVNLVHPVKWKTALDVPSDKRRSVGRAKVCFPGQAFPTEGEAEAAMMAYYQQLVEEKGFGSLGKKQPSERKAPVSVRKRRPGRPQRGERAIQAAT